jgi:PAS domain-containing protein
MDPKSIEPQALAAALDNLAVGVIIVIDENRILYTNRAGVQMSPAAARSAR